MPTDAPGAAPARGLDGATLVLVKLAALSGLGAVGGGMLGLVGLVSPGPLAALVPYGWALAVGGMAALSLSWVLWRQGRRRLALLPHLLPLTIALVALVAL